MSIPDDYIMPFGKHKGEKIGMVPASYLDWLCDQDWIEKFPEIVNYVEENREHIDKELDID